MSDADKKPDTESDQPTTNDPVEAKETDTTVGSTTPTDEDVTDALEDVAAEAEADAEKASDTAKSVDVPEPVEAETAQEPETEPAASAAAPIAGSVAAATSGAKPTDAVPSAIMDRLPSDMGPYLSLSRFDRPVGFWLLALPCFIGLAWARIDEGWRFIDIIWLALFGIGAVAMRGAGCTWNDIQDRHIDAQVERTKNRPLPSGQLSISQAWMWLGIQLVVGFLVWITLPLDAKIVALLAIPLVAAYPFMKRVTWWPQAWLGATMSWGVLVAAATAGSVSIGAIILWLGLACWVVGYDTIYALNDREDDELVGVKSTARLFGDRTGVAVFGFYVAAALLVALAAWIQGAGRIGALTVLAFLAHGTWQVLSLRRAREARALEVFRSNTRAGLIIFIGLAIAALFGYGNGSDADAETPAGEESTEDGDTTPWFAIPAGAPDTDGADTPFEMVPHGLRDDTDGGRSFWRRPEPQTEGTSGEDQPMGPISPTPGEDTPPEAEPEPEPEIENQGGDEDNATNGEENPE